MSSGNILLDDPMHARVFAEAVVPESRFHQATPQENPRAIITAGQPGAGKGGLVRAAETEFRKNVVSVDPDVQREFVPGIEGLKEQHPLKWSGESHPVAKAYADGLRDLSIEGRRNLIIDTTLAGADPVIGQIRTMQSKGYEVEIRAVSSHRLESELGIDRRFTEDLVKKGSGRHVPGDFHDFAYKALPGNLDKVHEQTGVRIRLYNREGAELYDSRTSPLKPGVVLEQAREARMHDPKVTRITAEIGREQQDFHRKLPETLERNPVISRETAKNLPPERAALGVVARIEHAAGEAVALDRAVRIEPFLARGAAVLKATAIGASVVDSYTTGRETARLLDQDNLPGAQSKILHFGARNIGMAAGAALGSSAGAAFGVPGRVIGGIAGGVGAAVAGEKMAEVADRARIYTQRGSDGHAWQSDAQHPERGWSRHAPAYGTDAQGKATYEMQTLQAGPRLADELNYKASSTAVELALAHAPALKPPFTQPAGPGDAHAVDATPWTRDPDTRQWSRYVADPTQAAMGNPTGSTEQASAQRSAQLDQAAKATIAENLAHSRPAIAQRYQDAYDQYGWKQHGPVPAAVLNAEHTPPSQQRASDGRGYTQGKDGQWTTKDTLYGTNTAQGNVRDELNATRQQVQAPAAAPVAPAPSRQPSAAPFEQAQLRRFEAEQAPPAPVSRAGVHSPASEPPLTTHESRIKPTPGGMSFAEAHKRRDEPEKISPGSLQPVDKLPKPDRMHEQTLLREIGIVNAKTEQELGKALSPQKKSQPSVERTQERAPEQAPGQQPPAQAAAAVQTPMPAPTRGEPAVAPVAPAPSPIAQPAQPVQFEPSIQPTPSHPEAPQPVAQTAASDMTAVHARMAAMQEEITRLTVQPRQDQPVQRSEMNDRQPAHTAPRTESVASTRPTDPRDSNHSDHRDFQKIYAVVAKDGRWNVDQCTNIASKALADFKAEPLAVRLDLVTMDSDTKGNAKLFVGYTPWGGTQCLGIAMVDPVQAARVPAEQSFDKVNQIGQQALQEQQRAQQQGNDQGPKR